MRFITTTFSLFLLASSAYAADAPFCVSRVAVEITDAQGKARTYSAAGPELDLGNPTGVNAVNKVQGLAYGADLGDGSSPGFENGHLFLNVLLIVNGKRLGDVESDGMILNGGVVKAMLNNQSRMDNLTMPSTCDTFAFRVTCSDSKAHAAAVADADVGGSVDLAEIPASCQALF